jgi:hypothetical protein
MDSVSKDNGAIESKSWFRAVPVDELIYGMIVRSFGRFSKSGCSVRQTSSVQDRARQEIASTVSSFSGVSAFWAASCAAFSQNWHKLHPWPLTVHLIS